MSGFPEDESADTRLALTIGAVSRATGIPVNTIRTWERRYGFPKPRRSEGGQRLYSPRVVPRLRLVAQALEEGHRPRQVVGLSFDELRQLVGRLPEAEERKVEQPSDEIEVWMQAARRLDGESLDRGFSTEYSRLGMEGFLRERASPFLNTVGAAWAAGELDVAHEHFASERLRHFLTSRWRPLSDRARGGVIVCAALPGEQHDLGLHMVAATVAIHDMRVIFLGANTPLDSIQATANQSSAVAVLISVAPSSDPDEALKYLIELRESISPAVELLVGGAGAPREVTGVLRVPRLHQLANWAQARSGR